ncbi:MAG: adenylyl-sulfate kinase [Comamonas sp.]
MNEMDSLQKNKYRQPLVLWFTGLSGAGKTTLATATLQKLKAQGVPAVLLDGDILRQGLCQDLGFSAHDRSENIRRAAEVCKITRDAGMVTLAAFISPLHSDRLLAQKIIGAENFREIYVGTALETCISRDVKGLYKKAIAGEIKNFTGISSDYEVPRAPFLKIETDQTTVDFCAEKIIAGIYE